MPRIELKYAGWCRDCEDSLEEGETAFYAGPDRLWCMECATEHEEYYPKRKPTPPKQKPATDPWQEPEAALGLLPNPPLALAEAAYRVLSKAYHPDTGHPADGCMERINASIEAVRRRYSVET